MTESKPTGFSAAKSSASRSADSFLHFLGPATRIEKLTQKRTANPEFFHNQFLLAFLLSTPIPSSSQLLLSSHQLSTAPKKMPVLTRRAKRIQAIDAHVKAHPCKEIMDMMEEARSVIVPLIRSAETPTAEQMARVLPFKQPIARFMRIPGIETHFLLKYVIAEVLVKMIEELEEKVVGVAVAV